MVRDKLSPEPIKDDYVIVRFKLKNEDEINTQMFSWEEYENLKNDPMTEFAEIMN